MPNISTFTGTLASIIEEGVIERELMQSLRPALLWNQCVETRLHQGGIGELVSMTREGLITPSTEAEAELAAGADPTAVTRSREQFSYRVKSYSKYLDLNAPSSYLAAANTFLPGLNALGFQGMQSINRIRRDRMFAAYAGGNSFATAAGAAATALVVADATGFGEVIVDGVVTAVSSTNPGTLALAGTNRTYTAVDTSTNTITLSSAQTWSQYDSVVRSDATPVFRQSSRATDRLVVAGDTPTMATFRDAAAWLRGQNVPGMDGTPTGDYWCFIDSDVENALNADTEFRSAINGGGLALQAAAGILGRYAGIVFVRQPKSESKIIASSAPYQTTIHRSIMVGGGGALVEAYVPEESLVSHGQPYVGGSHYRVSVTEALSVVLQAPTDKLGRKVVASWIGNMGWGAPTDINNATGSSVRHKRAVAIHTAGPA
jgi:hypothetical protein